MTANELALHVIKNWQDITGFHPEAMYAEGDFPEEVYELIELYEVDIDAFQDAWSNALG